MTKSPIKIPVFLSALTILMITVIEIKHPYFFLQDDNRQQNLAYFVHNIRSLIGGEIPLFNFHQYLGTPVLSCIQSAAFYPINYIGLCMSKLFLGNYFGTMEFIAVFHLVMASLGFYYLIRYFELAEVSCIFGAIAWSFCAFVITAGNSWIQILGYAAYLPLILLFSIKQISGFNLKNFVILIFLRVLNLYLGNPPYFIYTVTFDVLTVTLLYFVSNENCKKKFAGFFFKQSLNYICVFIIALPLLLPAFHQLSISADRKHTLSWDEFSADSYIFKYWLEGLFNIFATPGPHSWPDQQFLSHIGYLTIPCIIIAITLFKHSHKPKHILLFTLLALFALLWASDTFITKIFYYIPYHNRLRWPFKLAFFSSFYLIIVSSFGFDILYKKIKKATLYKYNIAKPIVTVVFAIHIINFLYIHAILPQHMFSVHFDEIPLNEQLKEKLVDGRIVTIGKSVVIRNKKRFFEYSAPLLGFNYATLWGLYHFAGYEVLISKKNLDASLGLEIRGYIEVDDTLDISSDQDIIEHLRKWGVKWYVIDKRIPLENIGTLVLAYTDKHRNILYDPGAYPLVYWIDKKGTGPVKYSFTANSIKITTNEDSSASIIVNILNNPFFNATIDGKSVSILETKDSQIELYVPKGNHLIVIKYRDPYFDYGLLISLSFTLFLVIFCYFLISNKKRNSVGMSASI